MGEGKNAKTAMCLESNEKCSIQCIPKIRKSALPCRCCVRHSTPQNDYLLRIERLSKTVRLSTLPVIPRAAMHGYTKRCKYFSASLPCTRICCCVRQTREKLADISEAQMKTVKFHREKSIEMTFFSVCNVVCRNKKHNIFISKK